MVFNAVFGASPISYLFMNVREKLSLCYFCSSALNMQKGTMVVYAGIANENKKKTYDEILNQLERIRNGDISDEDMESAYKMLINQYQTVTDDLFSTDSYYLNSYIGKLEISEKEFIAGISSVTKDDVIRCAKKVSLDTVYFLTSSEKESGGDD
jgi:predicted Zn-dependent peptidase